MNATFKLAPWSRSYAMALTTPETCVFSTVRNSQREPLFKWVGPIDRTTFVMVARKESGLALQTLDDARPYRIGVFTQDVRELTLRNLGGFKIDTASEDALNARKLIEGRIDLWYTDLEALQQEEPEQRAKMEIVLREPAVKLYLACNKEVEDAAIEALNAVLSEPGSAKGAD